LVAALLWAGCAEPQTAYKRDFDFRNVRRVAVLAFSGQGGEAAADHLLTSLLQSGADVVERRQLGALLKETRLGREGALDPRTMLEIGHLLGVDAIFAGSVTSYSPAQSYLVFADAAGKRPTPLASPLVISRGPAVGVPGSDVVTSAASVGLSARMVDVQTGSVVWSAQLNYEGIDADAAMVQICRSFVRSLRPVWLSPSR